MAALDTGTTAANRRRAGVITLAAILYCWFGLAFLVSGLLIGSAAVRNGALPVVFGIEMMAGPFLDRLGLWRACSPPSFPGAW